MIAQDTARFSMFGASVTGLEVPEDTQIKWVIGHSIAASMNDLVRALYQAEADWLFILGDDHVFAPNLLMRLLEHEKDIVVPICLTRLPPYKPVVFTEFVEDTMYRRRLDLDQQPGGGLIPIHSAGTAGMVVRREVFDTLEEPWFEFGMISSEQIGEDVYFCDKARDAGFDLYCDLDTPLGHITSSIVWPVRQPQGWTYGFTMTGGLKLTMPPGSWEEADRAADHGLALGAES